MARPVETNRDLIGACAIRRPSLSCPPVENVRAAPTK